MSSRTLTEALVSQQLPRWATSLIPAAGMLFAIILVHAAYTTDDIAQLMSPAGATGTAFTMLHNARPIGWALDLLYARIGIDTIRDFPLFAAGLVAAFVYFSRSLAVVFGRHPSREGYAALSALTLAVSPSFLEFLSYRLVADILAIALVAMGFALRLAARPSSARRPILLAAAGLVMAYAYQPAIMAVLWLLAWKVIFESFLEPDRWAQSLWASTWQGLSILSGVCLALVLLGLAGEAFGVQAFGRASATGATLAANLGQHLRWVGELFILPSGRYLGRIPTPLYLAYSAIMATLAVIGVRRKATPLPGAASILILLAAIVATLQNPENILTPLYWPSLRSSFYLSLLPPLCSAFAASASQRLGAGMFFVALVVMATSSLEASISWAEVQRRDTMLADEIARQIIRLDPDGNVTQVRFPEKAWEGLDGYFGGIAKSTLNWSDSQFFARWSQAPFLEFATGMKLTAGPPSDCEEAPRRDRIVVQVKIVGNAANVCFY
jgi:hypothetical protein